MALSACEKIDSGLGRTAKPLPREIKMHISKSVKDKHLDSAHTRIYKFISPSASAFPDSPDESVVLVVALIVVVLPAKKPVDIAHGQVSIFLVVRTAFKKSL